MKMQIPDDQQLWFLQSSKQSSPGQLQEQERFWDPFQLDRQAEVFVQQLPSSQQGIQEPLQSQWPDPQQPYQPLTSTTPNVGGWPADWSPIAPDQQPLSGRPPHSSTKNVRKSLWIGLCIVVALLVFDGVATYTLAMSASKSGNAITTVSATPSSATLQSVKGKTLPPIAPSNMVQIESFNGHLSDGNWYHSKYFSVPDNWQVQWICLRGERSLSDVKIVAYDHSGKPIAGDDKIAAQGNCEEGFGVGAIQKHGGTIQLQIYAQGDFMVIVDALK